MPKAILERLPAPARKIYEDAWKSAKEKNWDDERAAKYAIGAVKQAGFRKNEATGNWTKMSEDMAVVFGAPVNTGDWIEVACTGEVVDMNGHRVSITSGDFERWIQAFENNERGQDLPVTLDHPAKGGAAAGWFRGLRRGPKRDILGSLRDTLIMRPEWTSLGKKKIDDREYVYFSLEITPDNILRGGSLVNYPAIKGLKPVDERVAFTEYYLAEFQKLAEQTTCPECSAPVPEGSEFCPACGTAVKKEEAPEEEKESNMSEKVQAVTETPPDATQLLAEMRKELEDARSQMESQLSEAHAEVVNLREQNETLTEQVATLNEINELLRLSEKVNDFMLLADDSRRQIAPAYGERLVQILLAAPEIENDILDIIKAVALGDAIVELGERGNGHVPSPRNQDAIDARLALHEKTLAKMSEGMSYKDALLSASKEGA